MKSAVADFIIGIERMEVIEMTSSFGQNRRDAGCGGRETMRPGEPAFEHRTDEQRGFVHALWLLVVLSAFLFGATLVNVGIGMKTYEASSRQSKAIEKLTLSIKEIHKSVHHLSELIEEAEQTEQEGSDRPMEEGRI